MYVCSMCVWVSMYLQKQFLMGYKLKNVYCIKIELKIPEKTYYGNAMQWMVWPFSVGMYVLDECMYVSVCMRQ